MKTLRKNTASLIALVLLGSVSVTLVPQPAEAAKWTPRASEKLIKLPGDHLRRAVENDFRKSELASAISQADEKVGYKKSTLEDLKAALNKNAGADDEVQMDLEYQLIGEKQAYLSLARERQQLKRKKAKTRIRLYEKLLAKMTRKEASMSPQKAQLVEQQKQAQNRFQGSLGKIDTELMQSSVTSQSRYATEYAQNMAAIENLVAAINNHPMNQAPTVDGVQVTQADFVRNMIAQNQAEIALIDQEDMVLGYMAKLVSLDALALAENISVAENGADIVAVEEPKSTITSTVDLFISN
ncbi:MAG: hypothetical protein MI743_01330 [Sneathiellales bacterium]|nr:hypothetical protein [Sneathiellales bacterium]